MIDIKNFDLNMLKLDKKAVLNHSVFYIGYVTKNTEHGINSVNSLYLMINNRIIGDVEEKDGDKYLIISPENGDTIQKHQEVFDRLKEITKKINEYNQPIKYDDNYMQMKFNTDDIIPLNKIIYLPAITIFIRSVTRKDDTYYPQVFLD